MEAAGEDAPVGDGVDDGAVALLGQRRVVPVLVVAEETLENEKKGKIAKISWPAIFLAGNESLRD